MDYINPEPKFCLDQFSTSNICIFLKINGRDAVPAVFFNFIRVYRIVSVDLGPLNLAWGSWIGIRNLVF
jgi:hypothetical protein